MSITGRVYKIIHTQSNICYVGSTFNTIRDRFHCHQTGFRFWESGKGKHEITIYPFFKQYGIDQFKMVLIKEYQVCDKEHLRVYEQLWINKLKPINKMNPFHIKYLSKKQYRADHAEEIKEYQHDYRIENREKLLKKQEQYRAEHKEQIVDGKKKYYANNDEKVKAKSNQYYEENKAKVLERVKNRWATNKEHVEAKREEKNIMITCECGAELRKYGKGAHIKTKKTFGSNESTIDIIQYLFLIRNSVKLYLEVIIIRVVLQCSLDCLLVHIFATLKEVFLIA